MDENATRVRKSCLIPRFGTFGTSHSLRVSTYQQHDGMMDVEMRDVYTANGSLITGP
jgi:hypothetical protein